MSKASRAARREQRIADSWQTLYDARRAAHDVTLKQTAERQAERLSDPAYATSLGLPAELPEFTRRILGTAMAHDTVGPKLPKRSKFSDTNEPTVLHNLD